MISERAIYATGYMNFISKAEEIHRFTGVYLPATKIFVFIEYVSVSKFRKKIMAGMVLYQVV